MSQGYRTLERIAWRIGQAFRDAHNDPESAVARPVAVLFNDAVFLNKHRLNRQQMFVVFEQVELATNELAACGYARIE